jgi:asparagine synthetase B (glutamine-hydrolysing)
MEGSLPHANLYRRKMGFGVPIGPWFRGPLRELLRDSLLAEQALRRDYFEPAVVRTLVDDHLAGRKDYAHQLWALVMLEQWYRTFIDGSPPHDAPSDAGLSGSRPGRVRRDDQALPSSSA